MKDFISTLLSFSIVAILVFSPRSGAQAEPQTIMTWRANNFYPADYPGKALATPDTPVVVALEVLKNQKLVDLRDAEFIWWVNEKVVGSGIGLKEVSFPVQSIAGDSIFVRVSATLSEEEVFGDSIRIPVFGPVVAIESPHPEGSVKEGTSPTLRAIPYFFNVQNFSDFEFSWKINGESQNAGNDNALSLEIGKSVPADSRQVLLSAFVQNTKNQLEFASKNLILSIF